MVLRLLRAGRSPRCPYGTVSACPSTNLAVPRVRLSPGGKAAHTPEGLSPQPHAAAQQQAPCHAFHSPIQVEPGKIKHHPLAASSGTSQPGWRSPQRPAVPAPCPGHPQAGRDTMPAWQQPGCVPADPALSVPILAMPWLCLHPPRPLQLRGMQEPTRGRAMHWCISVQLLGTGVWL